MDNQTLINNIEFVEVWFAVQLMEGCDTFIPKAVRELIYHIRPPLPLSEEDKEKKLVYPSRTSDMKSYLQVKYQISQYLA